MPVKTDRIDFRVAMAAALATLHADSAVPAMKQLVADSQEQIKLRDRVAGEAENLYFRYKPAKEENYNLCQI